MSELIDELLVDARGRMGKSVEATQTEFGSVRTGRASPSLLDRASGAVRRSATMPLAVVAGMPRETWRTRARTLPWAWLLAGIVTGLLCAGWAAHVIVRRLSPVVHTVASHWRASIAPAAS